MKDRCEPPRYVILLPEEKQEQELNALEILRLFKDWRITTATRIRPVSGGEWRELREEPEFAVALWRCDKELRKIATQPAWTFWGFYLFLLFPFLPFLLMPPGWIFANWQLFFLKTAIHVLIILMVIGMCLCHRLYLRIPVFRMVCLVIPYVSSIAGFLLFHTLLEELPPEKRKLTGFLNALTWGSLLLFLIAVLFLPGNTRGGQIALALYLPFPILFALLSRPFVTESRRRGRLWLEQNPPPEKTIGESPLDKAFRRERRRLLLPFFLSYSLAILLMFSMLTLPYWAIGSIRLKRADAELKRHGYSFPALLTPDPEAGDTGRFRGWEEIPSTETPSIPLPPEEYAAQVKADLREIAPALDRFRKALRSAGQHPPDRSNSSPIAVPAPESDWKWYSNLYHYLSWRMEELKTASAAADPEELLNDLEDARRCDPESSLFFTFYHARIHKKALENCLRTLSEQALSREKERILRQQDAFPEIVSRYVSAMNAWFTEGMIKGLQIPVFYRNNLRATARRQMLEQLRVLKKEYYENREEYRKLLESLYDSNSLTSLFRLSDDKELNRDYSLTLAHCRLMIAAIELEEYRRKHGSYPESPELPRDPFSGKPLRHRANMALYSVGPDGIDDMEKEEKNSGRSSDDITFRLP